jgi:hypothetical protein
MLPTASKRARLPLSQATVLRPRAGAPAFAGLFLITFSTLMYEVLLTRIFSVTMWYHFAFVAVSVALFGMTAGALIVHLFPKWFDGRRLRDQLAVCSLLFSLSVVGSFLLHLQLPVDPKWTLEGVSSAALTYAIIAVPFTFSGVVVCLTLTRFHTQVSGLYAADLAGAALGAITLVWLLDVLEDGPSAVLAVGAFAAAGAACYAAGAGWRRFVLPATALATVVLGGLALGNAVAARDEDAFLRIVRVKGFDESMPLYETWNAFSRIQVIGNPEALSQVSASGADGEPPRVRRLGMTIDATAGTTLTSYNGDPESVAFLQDDVVSLAHRIRPHSRVLLIGVGGGYEVLLSLSVGHPSITAVEMNGAILDAVNGRYGDFTGHLDRQPGVRFVNDEGRAFVERTDDRYDILQIPFTDTWAATGAGAFALSENGLYTVDAWGTFYDHLSDDGVLTVTRWYLGEAPVEAYRLTALAAEALRRSGVERPREHIMLVKSRDSLPGVAVANILIGKRPFSEADIAAVEKVSRDLLWEVMLAPGRTGPNPLFAEIVDAEDVSSVDVGLPVDIRPPTDDRPFFFQMVGFSDLFDTSLYGGLNDYLARPVLVLFSLTVAVLALTAVCIVLPLVLTSRRIRITSTLPLLIFFCAIGLGFLLIEIAQMQRLILFLGHPTYGLSVVLFSLLLFSGIGSLASERIVAVTPNPGVRPSALWPLAALLAVLVVFAFVTPAVIDGAYGQTTPLRIASAVALVAPMAFLMGMPFPLGMKIASLRPDAPTAFFWGINGATSVCASVLAVAISMGWGISMAFWAGCFAYAVAAAALAFVVLRQPTPLAVAAV